MSAAPASDPGAKTKRSLPGGPLRTVLRKVLPAPVKRSVKRRLTGTRWFPAPPPRRAASAGKPATPAPPAMRRLAVSLPPPPGADAGPAPLRIDCPPYMFIPRKLDDAGLGAYEPYALD